MLKKDVKNVDYENLFVHIIAQYVINVLCKWIVIFISIFRSLSMDGCMYWP